MLKLRPKQLSLYSLLHDKIPENHILKLIVRAVDFSFINTLLDSRVTGLGLNVIYKA